MTSMLWHCSNGPVLTLREPAWPIKVELWHNSPTSSARHSPPWPEVLDVETLSELLLELGLDNPPSLSGDNQFVQKLNDAVTQCGVLETAIADLADKTENEDLPGILNAVTKIIEAIAKLIVRLGSGRN